MSTATMNPLTAFDHMKSSAKVWVYQANKILTNRESETLLTAAHKFVSQWASHGSALVANVALVHNVFLIFAVDETDVEASGCSVDKSVHFVKSIEQAFQISFFDRTLIAYTDKANELKYVRLPELKKSLENNEISVNTLVFNNLISTIEELKTGWHTELKNTWLSKYS